jgi:polyisoprenoid-binding protein YceI
MNSITKTGLLLTIAMLMIVTVNAQNFVIKTSKSSIQGTSSLHDWESAITKLEWKGAFVIEKGVIKSVPSAEVTIPVVGIKSTKGRIMDNKTYDAFLFEKNPTITFLLVTAQLRPEGAGSAIDATGYLTMAGTMKSIKVTGLAKVLANGDVQLSISKKLKMTDFKMEQPTAMMGTITVGDEVTVNFDLTLTPSPADQQAKK